MHVEKEKKNPALPSWTIYHLSDVNISYLNMLLENTAGAKERWGMLLEIEVETRL